MLIAGICTLMTTVFVAILKKAVVGVGTDDYNPLTMGFGMLVIGLGLGFTALHVSQQGAQLAGGGAAMDSKGIAGAVMQMIFSQKQANKSDKKPDAPSNSAEATPAAYAAGQRARQIISSIGKRGG